MGVNARFAPMVAVPIVCGFGISQSSMPHCGGRRSSPLSADSHPGTFVGLGAFIQKWGRTSMGCARLKAFIINVQAGTAAQTFYLLAKDGGRAHARTISLMRERATVVRGSVPSPSHFEIPSPVISISPTH
jgi:hypothetical protein